MPHTIRTERLVLRPGGLRGARAFWHEVRHWPVMRNTSVWPFPLSYAHCAFMVRKAWEEAEGSHVFFAVQDGQPTGSIGLHQTEEGTYSVGYMFGADHWGQGLASEAVRAICTFGFRQLRAKRLTAEVALGNDGSVRVLEKNHFVRQPQLRMGFSRARQADAPLIGFDLTRTDYRP